ncbi:MAG: rhodanese-like domain-containing protein [Pseudomonadota bacterium]
MTETRRKPVARRALLGGAGVLFLGGAYLFGVRWRYYGDQLDAVQAHRAATRGDILLIDIRTPEEWQATGVGEGARMLDMRRPDFVEMLDDMAQGDRSRPVAIICARGVRSARLSKALTSAGFSNIIDVPEGMIGSFAGPGWLKRGLPVNPV